MQQTGLKGWMQGELLCVFCMCLGTVKVESEWNGMETYQRQNSELSY